MNLQELIKSRYSCRSYQAASVEPAKLDYIMECVRLAPSAVNKQPWRFRIVSSDEDKAKLQRCYPRTWFYSAPMYIIASLVHDEEWVRSDGKAHGNIDVAIAVEHLCLAAAEQGLGTCWVCNFDADLCRRLFHLPDTLEPVACLPLGYEAADHQPRPFQRKEIDELWLTAEN
jgi:nitroreductase